MKKEDILICERCKNPFFGFATCILMFPSGKSPDDERFCPSCLKWKQTNLWERLLLKRSNNK